MGVDIVHCFGSKPSEPERQLHRPRCTSPLFLWRGDVEGVRGSAVARQFGVDASAASLGAFQTLQHQNARPLSHDESIPLGVKGTAGALWLVVAGGDRPHILEASHGHLYDDRLASTADHHLGISSADHFDRLSDGVGPRGAGGGDTKIGTPQTVGDGDSSRGGVGHHHRYHKRAHAAGAVLLKDIVILQQSGDTADSSPDEHARRLLQFIVERQVSVGDGLTGGLQGKEGKASSAARHATAKERHRVKVLDLSSYLYLQIGGVKQTDPIYPAAPSDERFPCHRYIVPQGRDCTQAGDNNSLFHNYSFSKPGNQFQRFATGHSGQALDYTE